jgi:hypothetical protein
VIDMNHGDPDGAACLPASKPPTAVSRPSTSQHPAGWLSRPTDPLRVGIVTAFCTCDIDPPTPSYMPRLPTRWPDWADGGLGSRRVAL